MNKAMNDVQKYKRKNILFVFLAIALVLATWYKLKIQGITLTEDISYEEVLICENAEETHVHSEVCYEKIAVISSDKQEEIDNTTDEKTTNTTETNNKNLQQPEIENLQDTSENKQDDSNNNEEEISSEDTQETSDNDDKETSSEDTQDASNNNEEKTNSEDAQEVSDNNEQKTNSQENQNNQEKIPKETEQTTIANNANSISKQTFSLNAVTTSTNIATNDVAVLSTAQPEKIKIIYTVDTTPDGTDLKTTDFRYKYESRYIDISIPTVVGLEQLNRTTIEYVDEDNANNKVPYEKITYSTTITANSNSIIANLSSPYMTPYNSTKDMETNPSMTFTSLDRIILEFKGWKINGNSDNILSANTELTWEKLSSYAQDGIVNLTAKWEQKSVDENVNFYINYSSQALDSGNNVATRDENLFTPSLWASYLGNTISTTSPTTDDTPDNSFKADKKIRSLANNINSSDKQYIFDFPSDEYILNILKQRYAENLSIDGQAINADELDLEHYEIRWYVCKRQSNCWHIDGKLVRKEGKIVVTKTFTGAKSAIERVTGYSFEEQKITTNPTRGTSYHIEVKGGYTDIELYTTEGIFCCPDDKHTHATSCYTSGNKLKCNKNHTHVKTECYSPEVICVANEEKDENGVTTAYNLTFTWVVDVKYGIQYTITEKNHTMSGYIVDSSYNIQDPESTRYERVYNADGTYYYKLGTDGKFVEEYTNQSKVQTTGDVAVVKGVNNYPIDKIEDTVTIADLIKVNFTNTYAPTSAITIKKQDTVTNNGLSGAIFSLFKVESETEVTNPDGTTSTVAQINEQEPLKFTFAESIYTYKTDGEITKITSPTGGSIILNELPNGKYVLKEMSVPNGYDGNSAVEVTLNANGGNVTILAITKGTGREDNTNKRIELENASELGKVKITKAWDSKVPTEYLTQHVTVDLYLNNKPLSSYDLDNDGNADGDKSNMRVQLSQANDWSYTWEGLPLMIDGSEAIYSAVEVKIGDLSAVTTGKHNQDGTWQSYDAYTQYRAYTTMQSKKIDKDGITTILEFNLINEFHFVKIDINKIDGLGQPISDVTFKLQKIDEEGNYIDVAENTTLADGKISFVDLEYDTKYVLTETKANKGYYIHEKPIYVMIKKGQEQGDADRLFIYTSDTFETVAQESDYTENGYYEMVSLNENQSALNIINVAHTQMPKAGGSGVYSFYILGIFLMGSSTIIIYLRKKQEKERKIRI